MNSTDSNMLSSAANSAAPVPDRVEILDYDFVWEVLFS